MEDKFWSEAASTAVYLMNRSPTKILKNATPYEIWHSKIPDLSHLRVFGCEVMRQIPSQNRTKWDNKSEKLIFIGQENDKKNILMYPKTYRIISSRDVIFFEDKMFFKNKIEENENSTTNLKYFIPWESNSKSQANADANSSQNAMEYEEVNPEENLIDLNYISDENETNENARTSRRKRRLPTKFNDYIMYTQQEIKDEEPKTYEEAIKSPDKDKWNEAMNQEVISLNKTDTWCSATLPPDKNPIQLKWVYKIKRDEQGQIIRYKARLVAKGFMQIPGVDFQDTYAPVVRNSSIRFILGQAIKNNFHLFHLDVETAFLNGELEEEIYAQPILPVNIQNPNHNVIKLKKSLYGLKQSSKNWNLKLTTILTNLKFIQSKTDPCIFVYNESKDIVTIANYVDDIILSTNNITLKGKIVQDLQKEITIKDLGKLKFFLNIKIDYNKNSKTINLSQSNYINILKKFNMLNCDGANSPLDSNQNLSSSDNTDKTSETKFPYQEAVGSITYLSCTTRPDVSFAARTLSQYNKNPLKIHVRAVKKVLKYLKTTIDTSLRFYENSINEIIGYSDADYANDIADRKSISGYIFFI